MRIAFIRYNPHAFKIEKRGCVLTTERRHNALLNLLREIRDEQTSQLEDARIAYMFYDMDEHGAPCILNNDEYPELVKQWVRWVIGRNM